MKLVMEICGQKLVMSAETADKIVNALHESEWLEHKYVGSSAPSSYIDMISPISLHDSLKLTAMSDDTYAALQLVAKLQNSK